MYGPEVHHGSSKHAARCLVTYERKSSCCYCAVVVTITTRTALAKETCSFSWHSWTCSVLPAFTVRYGTLLRVPHLELCT